MAMRHRYPANIGMYQYFQHGAGVA